MILAGLAVVLTGVAWYLDREKVNGLVVVIMALGFLAAASTSYWKVLFGVLSALVAVYVLITVRNGSGGGTKYF